MNNIPPKAEVDRLLATLEKHPTRKLAADLIARRNQIRPWITRTYGGKALPVDEILRQSEPNGLIGKM